MDLSLTSNPRTLNPKPCSAPNPGHVAKLFAAISAGPHQTRESLRTADLIAYLCTACAAKMAGMGRTMSRSLLSSTRSLLRSCGSEAAASAKPRSLGGSSAGRPSVAPSASSNSFFQTRRPASFFYRCGGVIYNGPNLRRVMRVAESQFFRMWNFLRRMSLYSLSSRLQNCEKAFSQFWNLHQEVL